MAEMPIVDLSTPHGNRQIDWSQPQPFGTWRCDRGWETDGFQCGCLERATTDVLSQDTDTGQVITEHLCTPHALIAQLMSINSTLDRQADEMHTAAHAVERHEELLSDAADRLESAIHELSGNVWSIHRRMMSWPHRVYSYGAYWCGRARVARAKARVARDRREQLRRRAAASHAEQMHAYADLNPVDLNPEVIDLTDPDTAPHISSLKTPEDYRTFLQTGRIVHHESPPEIGEEVTDLDNDRGNHRLDAPGESGSV